MDDDYYKVLGIKRSASQAEIQRAYRELARKYHPDMNPDDKTAKEKFQRVQQAYDVLGNPEKREMYDRYGSSFQSAGAGGPAGGAWRTHRGGGGAGFEEFDFSQLFGGRGGPESFADIFQQFGGGAAAGAGRRRKPQPQHGANLEASLEVPFSTAVMGGEAVLTVQRPSGKVESITLKIPAGIADGKKIRLRGQGDPAPKRGSPGDLMVRIHVAPHPFFKRKGHDLEVVVRVTLAEAAMGAKIDVPTPKGTVTLTVPPATSSGRRLRIKGHGVPRAGGAAGDLYVEIHIALPTKIDAETADLIRKIEKHNPLNPRAELVW